MRRPATAISAIHAIEPRQIQPVNDLNDNRAKCPSGSHSDTLAGNSIACSRSHEKKFCAITGSS